MLLLLIWGGGANKNNKSIIQFLPAFSLNCGKAVFVASSLTFML